MSIKVAINGFGRIGRLAFRRMLEEDGFEVVAINDLSSPANLAYLLKYDTAHRTLHGHTISHDDKNIIFDGRPIPVIGQRDPNLIKWSDYGVDIVLECTGRFRGAEDAAVHVNVGGAKGVVISAPASTPTYVFGVNDEKLTAEETVISGASCTTNCLAPVMKVLNDKFGVVSAFMTTVHAYTNDQTSLDLVKEKDFRRGRAAAANIIPTSTGAAKAIHLVIPELKGRVHGGAVRVPVVDGSLVDLTLVLKQNTTAEEINAAMKEASETTLKDVLGYTEDPIVSSDIIGNTNGSLFDATQTSVLVNPEGETLVKVVAWYDNEYSYTCQYIRLAKKFAEVLGVK